MSEQLSEEQKTALKKLREPFPPNQVSSLPKPTKAQTDEVKRDFKTGIRCDICGQWHHPKVVHLEYVGHAALTDRFLEVDPEWNWEPFAVDGTGLPAIDREGGLWIRLTVAGMTRIGYGDAPGKMGGDAMKERIGDALRNAGIRFGCALDLWHKGDLHAHENGNESGAQEATPESDCIDNDEAQDLINAAASAGVDEAYVCKKAKIGSLSELKRSRFEPALNHLQALAEKQSEEAEA